MPMILDTWIALTVRLRFGAETRPWRMILAPIFTKRSHSLVTDQRLTCSGSARVRRNFAGMKARVTNCSRIALAA